MTEILSILQNASPIGVAALALVIILYMIRNEKKMNNYNNIATNHTSGIPEMHETLKRMESLLIQNSRDMNDQSNKLVEILTIVKKRR